MTTITCKANLESIMTQVLEAVGRSEKCHPDESYAADQRLCGIIKMLRTFGFEIIFVAGDTENLIEEVIISDERVKITGKVSESISSTYKVEIR